MLTRWSSYTSCADQHLYAFLSPVLYVIILSAALDLVPASTPKGLIAFCNIAPSFVAKVGWPYLLKGTIRYDRRVVGCCIMSVLGMAVSGDLSPAPTLQIRRGIPQGCCFVRWSRNEAARYFYCLVLYRSVQPRFVSTVAEDDYGLGLGELTFLQLSTTYAPVIAGRSVGYVFLENQLYSGSEDFRRVQVFCFWNRCCWASWCTPLVGAPKSWCASRRGVVISKTFRVLCCAFLIAVVS